jgi:hypothetical protein
MITRYVLDATRQDVIRQRLKVILYPLHPACFGALIPNPAHSKMSIAGLE